jgi:hypothetical protein
MRKAVVRSEVTLVGEVIMKTRQDKTRRGIPFLVVAVLMSATTLQADEGREANAHRDEHDVSVEVDVRENLLMLTADCRDCIADAVVFSRTDGRRQPDVSGARWLAHFNDADDRSVVWIELPEHLRLTAELTAVMSVDDGRHIEHVWRTIHLVAGLASTSWDFQCATVPDSCRRDANGAISELVDVEAK